MAARTVAEVIALLEHHFDPSWAEPWDKVGLICGDPASEVTTVLVAVDPVATVLDEAIELGAQLIVVHHPLLLTPISSLSPHDAKTRLLYRAIRAGVAIYCAHTNADVPQFGTNAALAAALGLEDPDVVDPTDSSELETMVALAPAGDADAVRSALAAAGAGSVGNYDSCSFTVEGQGRFRPSDGAQPVVGAVGHISVETEVRIEVAYPARLRNQVLAALRGAVSYEEAAFFLLPTITMPSASSDKAPAGKSERGHGRIGSLSQPATLGQFAQTVQAALADTAHGVRVAGDPDRPVARVAVLAGSGESLLEAAQAQGADAIVTSDLKHHRLSEFLEQGGENAPGVLDVAHWAAEWCWLPVLAELLSQAGRLKVSVSTRVTDPWTFRPDQGLIPTPAHDYKESR